MAGFLNLDEEKYVGEIDVLISEFENGFSKSNPKLLRRLRKINQNLCQNIDNRNKLLNFISNLPSSEGIIPYSDSKFNFQNKENFLYNNYENKNMGNMCSLDVIDNSKNMEVCENGNELRNPSDVSSDTIKKSSSRTSLEPENPQGLDLSSGVAGLLDKKLSKNGCLIQKKNNLNTVIANQYLNLIHVRPERKLCISSIFASDDAVDMMLSDTRK